MSYKQNDAGNCWLEETLRYPFIFPSVKISQDEDLFNPSHGQDLPPPGGAGEARPRSQQHSSLTSTRSVSDFQPTAIWAHHSNTDGCGVAIFSKTPQYEVARYCEPTQMWSEWSSSFVLPITSHTSSQRDLSAVLETLHAVRRRVGPATTREHQQQQNRMCLEYEEIFKWSFLHINVIHDIIPDL